MIYDDTIFTKFHELLKRELGEATAERMLPAIHGLRNDLIEAYTANMSYTEILQIFEDGFGDQNPSPSFENLKAFVTEHQPKGFPCELLTDTDDEYTIVKYYTTHGPFIVITNPDELAIIYHNGKTIGHCYATTDMYAKLAEYAK